MQFTHPSEHSNFSPRLTREEFVLRHTGSRLLDADSEFDLVECKCDHPEVCTGWKFVLREEAEEAPGQFLNGKQGEIYGSV